MIDINKTYQYANGEPAEILTTGSKPPYPVISMGRRTGKLHRHGPTGIGDDADLIEAPREAREWDVTLDREGNICDSDSLIGHSSVRVREVLPVSESPTPNFPAVGTRLRFLIQVGAWMKGEEITISGVPDKNGRFKHKWDKDNDDWDFLHVSNLTDGTLQVVPDSSTGDDEYQEPQMPEGFPPVVIPETDEEIDQFIKDVDSGKYTELPPPPSPKLIMRMIRLTESLKRVTNTLEEVVNASEREGMLFPSTMGMIRDLIFEIRRDNDLLTEAELVPDTRVEENPVEASYPPPESEWPAKPDAGEGMMWERMPMKGKYLDEETYISLLKQYPKDELAWEVRKHSHDWSGTVVFRAVPLQLREGGYYESREKKIVGPLMAKQGSPDHFKFVDPSGYYYTNDGRYLGPRNCHIRDLIREASPPSGNSAESDTGIPVSTGDALSDNSELWSGPAYEENGVWWRELGKDAVIQEGDHLTLGASWFETVDSVGMTPMKSGFRARRRVQPETEAIDLVTEENAKDAERFRFLLNQGIQWRGCYMDGWQEGEWLYSNAPDALQRIDAALRKAKGGSEG